MKAIVCQRYGPPEVLQCREVPKPHPRDHEVLIRIRATTVTSADCRVRGLDMPRGFELLARLALGFSGPRQPILGTEFAGDVEAVGARVRRFKPGDAVFANIFDQGTGSIAEFAVVPESAAALKPANLDFVQAASIPMVGLTSWQALKERIGLRAGQKVFIPAGSGGIGTFAIQLAKLLGAKVGTTTSTGNVDLVRSLGADEVVDYKQQEFEKVLRGYDAALGTVRGDSIEKSIGILKARGKIVSLVGPLDVAFARARRANVVLTIVFALMSRRIKRLAKQQDVDYSFLFARADGDQLAQIGKLLETQRIRPVIDRVFPFEQAKEALDYLALGRAKGKVVVQIR